MDARVDVLDQEIAAAFAVIGEALKKRLLQHGKKSFIGNHEIKGVLDEEVEELHEAVHANDDQQVMAELVDVSVSGLFGVASMFANSRAKKEGR